MQSNRSAIGARIKVTVDAEGTSRDIYGTVSSGGSFGSSPLQQHIGLGKATSIRSIEISWPSGQTQVIRDVEMDQLVKIREGEARPIPLSVKKFEILASGTHTHGAHH